VTSTRRLLALGLLLACRREAADPSLFVAGAASLRAPLEALGARYTAAHRGAVIHWSFGASGDLATQLAEGAPAQLFASAAVEPVERLGRAVRVETLCTLATNELVLVRRPSPALANLTWENLAVHPAVGRVALGVVPSVPAGVYAERALAALGALAPLRPKIVRGANVRHVLDLVARGEADVAAVYATDARGRGDVVVVGPPPPAARPAVRHLLAWLPAAPDAAAARAFGDFLCGPAGRAVFAAHGFGPP